MIIGIIADTHDCLERTRSAVSILQRRGVQALFHCGDLFSAEIVAECSVLPFYFVFGNHDADVVPKLLTAAKRYGAKCLNWGGECKLHGKRIAVVHGHMTMDLRPLLESQPDYLFSGHSHVPGEWYEGKTRRINPGALHRAEKFTAALLDLETDALEFVEILD